MVVGRTTRARLLRREQRGDARPPRIGELRDGGSEELDREPVVRSRMLVCPARRVTAPGDSLVAAPKDRPGEPQAAAVGGLGEQQQQTADFRHGEWDQVLSTPFWPSLAWRRVTAR